MVNDVACIPIEKGSENVIISCTLPTLAVDNTTLSGGLDIKIKLNSEEIISARNNCQPGEKIKLELKLPSGKQSISIVVTNSYGEGMYAPFNLWVGEDIPKAPKNIQLTNKNGKIDLKWEVEEEGIHKGYINSNNLTFDVVRNDGKIIAKNINTTSCSDDSIDDIQYSYLYYSIYASSNVGSSQPANSNALLLDALLQAPYIASFSTNEEFYSWKEENLIATVAIVLRTLIIEWSLDLNSK